MRGLGLKFIFLIAVLGVIFPVGVFAVSPESIFIDIVPEFPAPYEETTISLRSFNSNLDIVSISWTVNGKSVQSGIGKKSLIVAAGAAGTSTTIVANVFLPDGQITKSIVLRPSTIALLWQADDSYVPPFYRGKAIPTPGSSIKVVAMPEGGSAKSTTYTWKKDYSPDTQASGYGKNSYVYVHDFFDHGNMVTVDTLSVDQKYAASASVMVNTGEPEIIFYRDDADQGIQWGSAIADYQFIEGPMVVVAAPYFISPKDLFRPELTWKWFINDAPVSAPAIFNNVMPLQIEEGSSGTAKLRLEVENIFKFLQATRKELTVQF